MVWGANNMYIMLRAVAMHSLPTALQRATTGFQSNS